VSPSLAGNDEVTVVVDLVSEEYARYDIQFRADQMVGLSEASDTRQKPMSIRNSFDE
jgi:hypothetical protein